MYRSTIVPLPVDSARHVHNHDEEKQGKEKNGRSIPEHGHLTSFRGFGGIPGTGARSVHRTRGASIRNFRGEGTAVAAHRFRVTFTSSQESEGEPQRGSGRPRSDSEQKRISPLYLSNDRAGNPASFAPMFIFVHTPTTLAITTGYNLLLFSHLIFAAVLPGDPGA